MHENQAPNISIRQASSSDTSLIRKILWETWIATYSSFIPEDDLRTYFDEHYGEGAIGKLLCEQGIGGHIAEFANAAAGVMVTRKKPDDHRFYISSLYIFPAFQGRGIGKALLRRAEQMATALGMDALWLGVMIKNFQALEWYRSLGFTFVQELPFQMGKTEVSHLVGFLPLGSGGGRAEH